MSRYVSIYRTSILGLKGRPCNSSVELASLTLTEEAAS